MSSLWKIVQASQVARIEIGGTPSREVTAFWSDEETGHPWVSIADLRSAVVTRTAEYISDLGVASSNVKLVPKGTPIMSFKLTVGRVSIAGRDLYTNEAIAAFHVDLSVIDPGFLAHLLPSAARSVVTDSAIKGVTLNKKSLATMSMQLPSLAEQRRISEILDTVNEQISVTRAIAAKHRVTRQGLVTSLITSNGSGKKLPLGALADIGSGVTLGHEPSGVGTVLCPYLRVANVQDGRLNLSEIKYVRVRQSDVERYELKPGDVLMNEGGDADKLGRGTVWEGQISGCLHQNHVFRVRCHQTKLDPWYLSIVTGSKLGKSYFLGASKQTTNLATINSTQLKAFPVPVLSTDDQKRIVSNVRAMDRLIGSEEMQVAKLQAVRSGLIKDLLTGRVRVATS